MVRLGAFAAAEAEFTLVACSDSGERPSGACRTKESDNGSDKHGSDKLSDKAVAREAAELAGEASRARRAVDALRVQTLPSLRRNAIRGVAEGAETARMTVVGLLQNGCTNGSPSDAAAASETLGGYDSSVRLF